MTKNVTTPRPKKTVDIEDTTAMAQALNDAGIIAPEGTNVPPSAVPSVVVIAPTNDAGVNLPAAAGNSAPLIVPVTATPAQLAAREMRVNMGKNWIAFMGVVPGADGAAFVEPDKAALKAMRVAYAAANSLDLTDEDDLIASAMAVKANVDSARSAHESALANSTGVKLEYYKAARVELLDMLSTVDTLITTLGGKVNTPKKAATGEVGKSNRSGIKWQEKAEKLIAWAKSIGLDGFYFIDKAKDGYKDIHHALKLHAGREDAWEICTYNPAKSLLPVGTGEFVKAPLYYNEKGLPISTDGGDVPNIGGPMRAFVVPTVNSAGQAVMTALNTSVGVSATAKHNYILPDVAVDAAGL